MRFWKALLFGAASFPLFGADHCDCSHFPIKPKACETECARGRIDAAVKVLAGVLGSSDNGIPQDLLDKAHCIVIVPGLAKGAFIVGSEYGKGLVSCRNRGGSGWSAPASVRIEGGAFGFQIGSSSTDMIMLAMSKRGEDRLLSRKFTLGADGSVAAGPVGRTTAAQTDAQTNAGILSWSRSRGMLAGVSLEGASIREDRDDNAALYGTARENQEILSSGESAPNWAAPLIALLNKASPKER